MPNKTIVAIHQPNFFPWLGFFNKIVRADIFILMDNAQFPKTGGAWSNRVQLLVNGQAAWVTMPIVRSYHGTRRICEMKINNSTPWREKLLKTIQMNYARAPFFKPTYPWLAELIDRPADSLAEYNIAAIRALMERLNLNTAKLVLGSTLNVAGNLTELLIAMVRAVGGTAYLCGGGAGGYQDDELFGAHGMELIYQNFNHPVYPQANTNQFVPGLSIVDSLLNCGPDKTRGLILQSIRSLG